MDDMEDIVCVLSLCGIILFEEGGDMVPVRPGGG
jgi:hypothetical protein